MINKAQSDELCMLIRMLQDAEELLGRLHANNTNNSPATVTALYRDATEKLDKFIESITEKTMAYDDMSKHESQAERLGSGRSTSESFKLKASVQTYELRMPDLMQLISRELGVPESRITIEKLDKLSPGGGVGFGQFDDSYEFDGLKITVKNA